jgi:hypothetical protein
MRNKSAAPADGNLRGGKTNNGNPRIVQRPTGPRHVGEILAKILSQLTVARETQRAEAQP